MKFLGFLGKEIVLGTLIALLSVLTALASYQGSIADSKQNENEVLGMKHLNDGNAFYLSANQSIVYDYTMYDGWYTTSDPEHEAYYQASYSQELQDSIAANPDDPFSEAYYDAMYTNAYDEWEQSDTAFDLAGQYDSQGDGLQLVVLTMALGLAFAAWASLLKEESNMRVFFALFATIMLTLGVFFYTIVPPVG
ncbi:MAG: hypothetical protein AB1649_25950 [Chloroflexota bacterium]